MSTPARDIVALAEDAARSGANANRDNDFRVRHLVVNVLDHVLVPLVHRAGHDKDICVLGVAGIDDPEAFHVVHRCQAGKDLDIAAIAARCIVMDEPGGFL